MANLRSKFSRDAVIVSLATIGVAAILIRIDAFEMLARFSRNHEDWEVDELFTVLMVMSIGLGFLLFRRSRELNREIARRREAERLAQALARQDALTGIPNRRSFEEECDRRLSRARRDTDAFALFFIDFDRFKQINDNLGHEAGDRLLQALVERLKKNLRPEDFLGRLGGDEFAMIVAGASDERTLAGIAERLIAAAAEPVSVMGRAISMSISIGIAVCPRDGNSRETLLKKADTAMYRAKENGRHRLVFFDAETEGRGADDQLLELELDSALKSGAVIPFYQPIREFPSGKIICVEVLARWRHPTLGLLSAGDFVPLAEAAGYIPALFTAMLEKACADAVAWPADVRLAINVMPQQLCDRNFAANLLKVLRRHRFSPDRLEIEVTEDALVTDVALSRKTLERLKSHGMTVALDDFGTGYSSLKQLRELPFDRVKIDRSFVAGIGVDPQNEEIVSSTIRLCHALGLRTVAEGVEDQVQADWIISHGVDAAQGYYYARPLPAEELNRFFAGA
ncbi:putative bifunctional diguanylate cyclase/phosphodiesterase [Martelella endophytica]|uniref:putative bifunctional diguanylate cyclase/phosphodiesterase n=1 Tax=Martelella endophytica TaxID=1486262 RepID=UPI00130D78AE|nr:EAL domain-containing protein [Martelella endophytica]